MPGKKLKSFLRVGLSGSAMRSHKFIATLVLLGGTAAGLAAHAEAEHSGPPVSPDAPTLLDLGAKLGLPFPVPITNSMVYTWAIMALIFLAIRFGTKHLQEIPTGL